MQRYDSLRAAFEIREQLASEKRRLAFFFGAGTSMAVGIPGIESLTSMVVEKLDVPSKACFQSILNDLPKGSNVEQVLDRIRLYRELIGADEAKEAGGIKGASAARKLDLSICQAISNCVRKDPPKSSKPHLTFSQWLRALHGSRDFPVEIFTTNYDLLFEQALERSAVPFFDGFIGSVAPFFVPESVEAEEGKPDESIYPPRSWTRLWKLHGSINWHLQGDTDPRKNRIVRYSGAIEQVGEELAIFPSRDKYSQSRKLPFLSFQDRLRKFLSRGECLLIILGYGFSDDHLNEIVFQGLRSNPRSAAMVLVYGEKKDSGLCVPERILSYGQDYRNLAIYGPNKICLGGLVSSWDDQPSKRKETDSSSFWDEKAKSFTLGDFNAFCTFLEAFIGFQSQLKVQPSHSESGQSVETSENPK